MVSIILPFIIHLFESCVAPSYLSQLRPTQRGLSILKGEYLRMSSEKFGKLKIESLSTPPPFQRAKALLKTERAVVPMRYERAYAPSPF